MIKNYIFGIIVSVFLFSCSPDIKEKSAEFYSDFEKEVNQIKPDSINNSELIQNLIRAKTNLLDAVSSFSKNEKLTEENQQVLDSLTNPLLCEKYNKLWTIVDNKNDAGLQFANNKNWMPTNEVSDKSKNLFTITDNKIKFLNFETDYELKYNKELHCFETNDTKFFFDKQDEKLLIFNDKYQEFEFEECKDINLIVGTFKGSTTTKGVRIVFTLRIKQGGNGPLSLIAYKKMYGQTITQNRNGQVRYQSVKDDKYSFSFSGEGSNFNILFT